jgi:hypothetical protein
MSEGLLEGSNGILGMFGKNSPEEKDLAEVVVGSATAGRLRLRERAALARII